MPAGSDPGEDVHAGRLLVVAGLPAAILALTIVLAPLGYAVDPVGIIVHQMSPNVYIRHEDIAEIERVQRSEWRLGLCLFASGGFFRHFGWLYACT